SADHRRKLRDQPQRGREAHLPRDGASHRKNGSAQGMSLDRKAEIPSRAEQGGEWCVRLSTGSLSPDEQASFDKWMADDPLNREAFDQALTVWQGLHEIGDSPELISRRADALDALRRANRRRWSRRF